jgi:hypothetical protein
VSEIQGWNDEWIFTGAAHWKVGVETWTPERAADALATSNHGNRNMRMRVVSRYADVMRAGEWKLSPDGIVFGASGRLLQGQHRLAAVVRAGVPVAMMTWRGVDEGVFAVFDRGVLRSLADALETDRKLAEVARLAASIRYTMAGVNDMTAREMCEKLAESHGEIIAACASTTKVFSSAPYRLAAALRYQVGCETSREYVLQTYAALVKVDIKSMSPHAVALHEYHAKPRPLVGSNRQMADLARAWMVFDACDRMREKIGLREHMQDRATNEIRTILGVV